MFTGIVETVGRIAAIHSQGGDVRVRIDTADLDLGDVRLGDSIAVNGVCLTVVSQDTRAFEADVSRETLARTAFGRLRPGSPVNLEKALALGDRLGGHLVSGHVDGMGELVGREDNARAVQMHIRAPAELMRYIALKGSITVDGVSLTVNGLQGDLFELTLVPHTLTKTIMTHYVVGQQVNLEVDLLARYLERLYLGERAQRQESSRLTEDFLADHGYLK